MADIDTSREAVERLRAWTEYGEGPDSGTPNRLDYTHDSLDFQRDLRAVLAERDAARAEAAEATVQCVTKQEQIDELRALLAAARAAGAEAMREAATRHIAARMARWSAEADPEDEEINGHFVFAAQLLLSEICALPIPDADALARRDDDPQWDGTDGAHPARRAVLMTADWQPIESAPRDGTPVLVWDKIVGVLTVHWRASEWRHVWDSEPIPGPEAITHWMPLPPPPEAPHD